jgi:hypothetical protein
VSCTVEVPAGVAAAAEKFTGCEMPGVRLKAAGVEVTPFDSPLTVT